METIVRSMGALFLNAFLIRRLGLDALGSWIYATTIYSTLIALTGLGLEVVLPRELAKEKYPQLQLLDTAWAIKFAAASVVTLLGLFYIDIVLGTFDLKLNILIISVIFCPYEIIDIYFKATYRPHISAKLKVPILCVFLTSKVLLLYFNFSLFWIFVFHFLEQFTLFVFLLILYKKEGQRAPRLNFSQEVIAANQSDVLFLALGAIVTIAYSKFSIFYIKFMFGDQVLANFSALSGIVEFFYFIPMIISTICLPFLAKYKTLSQDFFQKSLLDFYCIQTWLALTLAFFIILFGPWVLSLVYGSKLVFDQGNLIILACGLPFVFQGVASTQYLVLSQQTNITWYRITIGMILHFGLSILLVPKYGERGALISTVLSYVCSTYGMVFFKGSRENTKLLFKSFYSLQLIHIFKGTRP